MEMDKTNRFLLICILICLVVMLFKSFDINVSTPQTQVDLTSNEGETVIQLAPDRIAVVDTRSNSGSRGAMLVYQYDPATKTLTFEGSSNYSEDFDHLRN